MAWHVGIFLEFLWSLEILSPNSCAPQFTQVHILASPNFLQFSRNFSQLILPPDSFIHFS
jgi:hypothetical protein